MDHALRQVLEGNERLFIRQRKEWTEILIDFETTNQYQLMDEQQGLLGVVAEKAGGFASFLRRGFLRSHRGFEVRIADTQGHAWMDLSRKFFFLFSDLDVRGIDGSLLGHVRRRFGLLYKRYDLEDATGQVFAEIAGPRWRLWTFPVKASGGLAEATIAKKWGGALREVFADADTFLIDFTPGPWTAEQRAVIFAAAISVDFDFFENNQGSGGLLGNLLPD